MILPIRYNNLAFRIIGSLIAAGIIVLYGTGLTLFEALHKPAFYIALVASFLIALCLSAAVHFVTLRLDKKYSWWHGELPLRAFWQFIFGLCLPVVLAILLAWLYFAVMGVNILDTGYFLVDFPIIVGMLALFNFYYIVHYLLVTAKQQIAAPLQLQTAVADNPVSLSEITQETFTDEPTPVENQDTPKNQAIPLLINSGNKSLFMDVNTEACLIYRVSGSSWVHTYTNQTYFVKQSISTLLSMYCNSDFFPLNRKAVIHRDAIMGTQPGKKSGTLQIILKPEIQPKSKDISLLTVSKDKVAGFREWLDT